MPGYRPKAKWHLPFLAALALQGLAWAAAPSESAPPVKPLPGKHLESVYRNGDLDSVVLYIKMGRTRPVFLDRGDSILAFKYLGIIYATDAATREKGRYYFNQLLRLDAKSSITDLLPGESARATFKEVREEFTELHPTIAQPADPMPMPVSATTVASPQSAPPPPAAPREKRSYTWWWVGGGVVVAGAAAAMVFIDPPVKTYQLHD